MECKLTVFFADEAFRAWHDVPEHRAAQQLVRERRYARYGARVERAYRLQRWCGTPTLLAPSDLAARCGRVAEQRHTVMLFLDAGSMVLCGGR